MYQQLVQLLNLLIEFVEAGLIFLLIHQDQLNLENLLMCYLCFFGKEEEKKLVFCV